MKSFWSNYRDSLEHALHAVKVTDATGAASEWEHALDTLVEWTTAVRDARGAIHLVGNGASANMASHMSIDWTKNARVRAHAYNDVAFLTAIGNDTGYDHVFADPIDWYATRGDLLVTISSSGNSANVLRAIEAARRTECRVVTFSGMRPDNASRRRGDLNVFVPALTYGIVECSHQMLLHAWLDAFMNVREWESTAPQSPLQ